MVIFHCYVNVYQRVIVVSMKMKYMKYPQQKPHSIYQFNTIWSNMNLFSIGSYMICWKKWVPRWADLILWGDGMVFSIYDRMQTLTQQDLRLSVCSNYTSLWDSFDVPSISKTLRFVSTGIWSVQSLWPTWNHIWTIWPMSCHSQPSIVYHKLCWSTQPCIISGQHEPLK